MWQIRSISAPEHVCPVIVGGTPGDMGYRNIGDTLGPQGACYVIYFGSQVLCLEDIGPIGAPGGGGGDWGIKVNSTDAIYYAGGGAIDIVWDGINATITGAIPSITVKLANANQNTIRAQAADSSCGFVTGYSTATTSLQVSTGVNATEVAFLLKPAVRGCNLQCVGFEVTGADGQSYNANTPVSENVSRQVTNGKLSFLHLKSGGNNQWTISLSNPLNIPCNIIALINSNNQNEDQIFYSGLPYDQKLIIDSYHILPPLAGFHPMGWSLYAECVMCQVEFYILEGFIAAVLPSLFAEITYKRIAGWVIGGEALAQLIAALKSIFQLDDGILADIANLISTLADPLTWPRKICYLIGLCDSPGDGAEETRLLA
jgi:hypothetical protein